MTYFSVYAQGGERGEEGGGRTVPYSSDCSRLKCSPLVGKVRMSKDIVVNECMPYNKWVKGKFHGRFISFISL